MAGETRLLLPVVAVTGSSILVGCGGTHSNTGCSFGTYGSYGSTVGGTIAKARPHQSRAAHPKRAQAAPGSAGSACYGPSPAAGLYEGTLLDQTSQQQTPVVVLIAEDGEGRISAQNGTYYRLNVFSSGYNDSGSFNAWSQGPDFPNGTLMSTGSFTAAPSTNGLSATLQYKSGTASSGNSATLTLTADQAYNMPSSLATLTGSWTYTAAGFTLNATVLSTGGWSGTDSNSCSYSGNFSLIDSSFNAYDDTYTRTCNGVTQTFTGLATYVPAAANTPAQLKVYADDQAGDFLVADLQAG